MKRVELEHLIQVVSALVRDRDLYVLGSQAILGAFPSAPVELLGSLEADIYPRKSPLGAVLVDDALGERSAFHQTYGYCAHAVDPAVCSLPDGWDSRLVPVRSRVTGEATGWCLEPHDLAISKLATGREKDFAFVRYLLRYRMVRKDILRQRLDQTPLSEPARSTLLAFLKGAGRGGRGSASSGFSRSKSTSKRKLK